MKKRVGLILFVSSVALIFVAIILTSAIDRTQSTAQDTRARAEKSGSLTLRGTVQSYDPGTNIVMVDNLKFDDTGTVLPGIWNVTPPQSAKESLLTPGAKIKIIAQPESMQVSSRTLIAKEMKR